MLWDFRFQSQHCACATSWGKITTIWLSVNLNNNITGDGIYNRISFRNISLIQLNSIQNYVFLPKMSSPSVNLNFHREIGFSILIYFHFSVCQWLCHRQYFHQIASTLSYFPLFSLTEAVIIRDCWIISVGFWAKFVKLAEYFAVCLQTWNHIENIEEPRSTPFQEGLFHWILCCWPLWSPTPLLKWSLH